MASLYSRNDSRAIEQPYDAAGDLANDATSDATSADSPPRLPDLQRIFDLSQDLMCIIDAHNRIVRVGASSTRILGYPPEELIGRKLLDLAHPADLQSTLLAHESVPRCAPIVDALVDPSADPIVDSVVQFENRYVRKDGNYVDLHWSASWVGDADGTSGASYFVARDITNQKRAEVLRESQREVLQMIATGSPLTEILRRVCGIMETFDAAAKCAVTLLDTPAIRVSTAISPSLPSRFLTIVQDTLLRNSTSECAATLRRGQTVVCVDMESDREWQNLSDLAAEHGLRACWITPVFGAHGELVATVAVFHSHRFEPTRRDLVLVQTAASLAAVALEHARTQTQLKESLTRLELAQGIARLGYWERDLAADKLSIYGEASHILGVPATERCLSLSTFISLVVEEDRPALLAGYGAANRGDSPGELQFRIRHQDGSIRHVHAQRRAIRDAAGRTTRIISAMQDVTERYEADLERQRCLTQLSSLADAARKMNALPTVEELLQAIADIARDLVGAHVAVCTLRGMDEHDAELCRSSHSAKYPNPMTFMATDSRAPSVSMAISTSGITVPLIVASGRQIGALCVADKQQGEFTPSDERVLVQLADLAAVGLENARLHADLEARVRRRTRELQDSNRELEAFSYSVSHDLRGPLRAIAGFTGLLRDRHYETIDADGRRCIDRVLAGTQRMSSLIDDLLELGRVTRVEMRRRQVDLSEYARAILARLREASAERAAAIVIEPQVWVDGDPGLLEIALENLLDNAWKFTAGRPMAEIRFGTLRAADGPSGGQNGGQNDVQSDDGEMTIFVQDNGVGFDPRYAANLFGVFQRLHAAGEFPGTGVGLATVQRIVQRHGGRIWADAGVDRGATIYFTIAKGQQ